MRAEPSDRYDAHGKVDPHDQPISVPANLEDVPVADSIDRGVTRANVLKARPCRRLRLDFGLPSRESLRRIGVASPSILKDLENRKTTGLAAMDLLAALAGEKDAAAKAAKETGLPPKAFAVFWALREDAALKRAGIAPLDLAKETEKLLARFPNARVNADEQRQLRAALYRPLLTLGREERSKIVDLVVEIVTQ